MLGLYPQRIFFLLLLHVLFVFITGNQRRGSNTRILADNQNSIEPQISFPEINSLEVNFCCARQTCGGNGAESACRSRGGGGGGMTSPAGPSGMGMNTVTTVMAFSVSAFFVLFVFTRLFCARIHLRAAAAEHAAAAQASDAASFPAIHVERGIRGMEQAVVTTFPTAKFVAGDDSQRPPAQEESQCTVCLEEYEAKDVVRLLPYCGHAFHAACIDTWLRQHPTCPICRSTTKHRAAAGTMPPLYYAVAMATPFQEPTSSSDQSALHQADAATAAAGAEHMDVTSTRLEILISDESASSGATCPMATLAPPFKVPTSSLDHDALREANPAAASASATAGTDHMDVMSKRLEIVISDEPASSDSPCPSADPAPSASEEYSCAETRRQSSQGNGTEHCHC